MTVGGTITVVRRSARVIDHAANLLFLQEGNSKPNRTVAAQDVGWKVSALLLVAARWLLLLCFALHFCRVVLFPSFYPTIFPSFFLFFVLNITFFVHPFFFAKIIIYFFFPPFCCKYYHSLLFFSSPFCCKILKLSSLSYSFFVANCLVCWLAFSLSPPFSMRSTLHGPSTLPYLQFSYFIFDHYFYSPAQLTRGFPLSDLLHKPWSQVSSLLPAGTCIHISIAHRVQHSHFSSIYVRRFASHHGNSRSRAFGLSIFVRKSLL